MDSWRSTYRFQILSWVLAYNVFGISMYFILLDFQDILEQSMPLRFWPGIMTNTISGIILGTVLGSIDALFKRFFRKNRSFLNHFLLKSAIYLGVFILFVLLTGFIMQWAYKGLDASKAIEETKEGYAQNIMLAYVIFTASTSILISFLGQVRQIIGPRKLGKLFLGRYFSPRSEEMIFMFLDLKDSTAIAEKLGHVQYSQFIQDCFYDLNQVIPTFKADVYQYVGDEAVLHWSYEKGLKNHRCLNLFQAFRDTLKGREFYYLENYGIAPHFKAGMHGGNITVTEVGEIKKEIAFHGDVLNTAARLEKACDTQSADLLISASLKNDLENGFGGTFTSVGELALKGKSESIEAFSVAFS